MFEFDLNKPASVYFIGIGGISMSGLAELLKTRGFTVSGSDRSASDITDHLNEIGIPVAIGQRAENIPDGIECAVYTAAVHADNPEYMACKERGIPLIDRAELLGRVSLAYPVSIGVSVRAREIQIQSLIGATDLFIRAPFLVEGVIIGFLGAAVPLSVLYAVYYKLVTLISDNLGVFSSVNFVNVNDVFAVLIPISMCISVGIGFFGSSFTLNRELRKFRRM